MTEDEIKGAIYSAVYRIVRISSAPTIDDFYKQTIKDTVGPIEQSSPSGWEDFWWESLATEIQNAFISRKKYILDFDKKWLKDHEEKTWNELLNYTLQTGEVKLIKF